MHLSPLSLAEKVRLTFGAAVLLILALALLVPYAWMRQLTRQVLLEANRARAAILLYEHFQLRKSPDSGLAMLNDAGDAMDPNAAEVRWVRFLKERPLPELPKAQRRAIESLLPQQEAIDQMWFATRDGTLYSNYVRIFRATDSCVRCHSEQGSASPFNRNEPVGAVIITRGAAEMSKTALLNWVWTVIAGLISGTGAIVLFYVITQRVILSPIRQLRALANNVAEGNLDIRSSISTRDEYEQLAAAFNHMLDVLQATQEKLRQANKQLDDKIIELSGRNIELFKANKVKSEFLANVSHEFRTPLNAIMGFAQVLRDRPEELKQDKGIRYAENIITAGQRLLNMVNDLLHLAKTEAGKIELRTGPTDIRELCSAVAGSFAEETKLKRIRVKLVLDENIPVISTDADKVQQILENFMSNAAKFTPEDGRIEIKASMVDDKTVRLAVADSGCGIADADKEKIFEKFCQAGSALTRPSSGSGLGLAICKELAEMLAAKIGLESNVGAGSTFWVDLPVILAGGQEQRRSETT